MAPIRHKMGRLALYLEGEEMLSGIKPERVYRTDDVSCALFAGEQPSDDSVVAFSVDLPRGGVVIAETRLADLQRALEAIQVRDELARQRQKGAP